jgi:hypothetical protein
MGQMVIEGTEYRSGGQRAIEGTYSKAVEETDDCRGSRGPWRGQRFVEGTEGC